MTLKNFRRQGRLSSIFHMLIIAIFLLGLFGCGYRANPFYTEKTSINDENVEFKLRKVDVKQ